MKWFDKKESQDEVLGRNEKEAEESQYMGFEDFVTWARDLDFPMPCKACQHRIRDFPSRNVYGLDPEKYTAEKEILRCRVGGDTSIEGPCDAFLPIQQPQWCAHAKEVYAKGSKEKTYICTEDPTCDERHCFSCYCFKARDDL